MTHALSAMALYGTEQPVSPAIALAAGGWSCLLCEGQLQNICWHGVEVVRGVSYLLRDRDWGTVPVTVNPPVIEHLSHGFQVHFQLDMLVENGSLRCDAKIHADQNGVLTFEVVAQPNCEIWTNRCGFVVLHPAAASGCALTVTHTDGRIEQTQFPEEISPAQPVFDIKMLSYQPAQGVDLDVHLHAELPMDPAGKFEMEDQRNWSDASFKTYVASLLDPWPYALPAHKPLCQRVSLHVKGVPTEGAAAQGSVAPISLGALTSHAMPAIGVGVPPGLSRAHPEEVQALRALNAVWWQVEFDLRDENLKGDVEALIRAKQGLTVQVQADVISPDAMSPSDAAARVANLCDTHGLTLDAIRFLPAALLNSFQPSDKWPDVPSHEMYVQAARSFFPAARVGSGVFTSFTELNRNRPSPQGMDFIGHLTCPIVHAPDDLSVMQTLACLPHIERSVRKHWPAVAYRLGPSTLAPRRNPYGSGTAPNPQGMRLALADRDPRHVAAFGAAWVVAYAATLAFHGLEVLTLLESHGPNGPFSSIPSAQGSQDDAKAWLALSALVKASCHALLPLHGLPSEVKGLAWLTESKHVHVIVANTSAEKVDLMWDAGWKTSSALPRFLNPFEVFEFGTMR